MTSFSARRMLQPVQVLSEECLLHHPDIHQRVRSTHRQVRDTAQRLRKL